ncbi:MAG: pyridoxal-phosphate dependent enzyme, partial [Pseudomonadota bacterium]|nr:pyridoxal-phosphate dependent enzyme [Pseudomonadota bacterium]
TYGKDFQEAFEYATELSKSDNIQMFPSFHPLLVRGVATYAWEIFKAISDLDAVYVPIGLGSGVCGVIAARDLLGLTTEIIGVVAENAPAYSLSLKSGRLISTNSANTIADGLACRVPNDTALDIMKKSLSRIVEVSENQIRSAIRCFFTDTHNVAEGAGAATLAALLKEKQKMGSKRVAVILTGGNIDNSVYQDVLNEKYEGKSYL